MALEKYRQKRNFEKTPEPAGAIAEAEPATAEAEAEAGHGPGGGLLFVVQKHAATRLHYDFRLELNGVLLSWAVPKGPSYDPHDRHLAVRTEDHPVEYGSFEGTIPKGEYGGGTVELWDRGTWEPEGDPHNGLDKGDLKFTLHGEKLRGGWVLARMKSRSYEEGKENWLLIKHRDEYAVTENGQSILDERPESVASGRTLNQIAAEEGTSVWHGDQPANAQTDVRPAEQFTLDPAGLPGARRSTAPMPRFVQPELATLVKNAPSGPGWLHEIKFDGYRAIARIEDGGVDMYSRNDRSWTDRYRVIADELSRLPVRSAMLDGEVVVQVEDGTTSFQTLQNDLGSGRQDRLLYYVFDLIYLDGWSLVGVSIEERKALLRRVLAGSEGAAPGVRRVFYTEHISAEGEVFFQQACRHGLEGIISKRAGSIYRPGVRGGEWLKTKCLHREEFVIGGFTDPSGTRIGFGALLVGTHGADGKLRYVSKVGTGYNDKILRELGGRLRDMVVKKPPFEDGVERAPKGAHWVRPELVAEIAFTEWTNDGEIRHPSFKGLREDKTADQVVEERELSVEDVANVPEVRVSAPGDREAGSAGQPAEPSRAAADDKPTAKDKPAAPPRPRRKRAADTEVLGVRLSNPDRVFWPQENVSKLDLVNYYQSVADRMMPYVQHRPIAMVRCPEGVAGVAPEFHEDQPGPCFFHKHPGRDFPGPFERVKIRESGGVEPYLTITEPGSLVALAQMGVLEIHIWGSTWPDIEHPDLLVFDLDPDPGAGWPGVVEGARLVRSLLEVLGLRSFVKTTGGKGLHVVVPMVPSEDWEGVKAFTKAIADNIVKFAPDKYTSTMSKAKRVGKTFVDYLRNGRGATAIAPYSTRAKDRATVAVPLRWEELSGDIRPDSFSVRNLDRRLSRLKSDPWDGYFEVQRSQSITEKMKRDVGVG